MTPDTPTTATAELINELHCAIDAASNATADEDMREYYAELKKRVAAVNATGTGDKQLIGELKNEVFNLRSAFAAAREQNENLQGENNTLELAYENLKDRLYAINSELAAAREQKEKLKNALELAKATMLATKTWLNGSEGQQTIDAALSPSQPTRTCTCHPADGPPVPCAEKYALSECKSQPTPDNNKTKIKTVLHDMGRSVE